MRPTNNNEELQKLNEIPIDSLREEFQEGISNIRKKILTNMKCKTMHGKNISGKTFANLIKS